MEKTIYQDKTLRNDNVFVKSKLISFEELTGLPGRRGYEKALISEDTVVNVVSQSYAHIANENYFYNIEAKLVDAGIEFATKSINRENRAFQVDYILKADKYVIKIGKGEMDILAQMLRFNNNYDSSGRTTGSLLFHRKVCSNGLYVQKNEIGFSVMHRGQANEIVLPKMDELIQRFISNEYYTLSKKFEVLAETPIKDLKEFVKVTAEGTKLFVYAASEKNPEPSSNARKVIETITREASLLNIEPNLWLGYNAFNELIHDGLKRTFDEQGVLDQKVFSFITQLN